MLINKMTKLQRGKKLYVLLCLPHQTHTQHSMWAHDLDTTLFLKRYMFSHPYVLQAAKFG